jgi:hypothetical protein
MIDFLKFREYTITIPTDKYVSEIPAFTAWPTKIFYYKVSNITRRGG